MLQTTLSRRLGIEHPLFNAGMGAAAGAELAAAVCNAGAGGVLGTAALPARFVRDEIRRLRALTGKPFAGRPAPGQRPGEGEAVGSMDSGGVRVEVPAYSAYVPKRGVDEAQAEQMALYAGQSCALVDAVLPAARIVERVMPEAAEALAQLDGLRRA